MKADDPARDVVQQSMVARIATLSRNGRPSITPLYFVSVNGHIWLGTVDWTIAVRNIRADPRVELLFEKERDRGDSRVLRISGQANVRSERAVQRSYVRRVALKYVLTPGGIRNMLTHIRQLPLRRNYHAQSAAKGRSCVIDVTPEQTELLQGGDRRCVG